MNGYSDAIRTGIALALLIGPISFLMGCATTSPAADDPPVAESGAEPGVRSADVVRPLPRRTLVDNALENTVTLRARGSNGDEISLGSGFFVRGGNVITNAHVLADADRVDIVDIHGEVLATATHALAIDIANDLAVLPTQKTNRVGLQLSDAEVQVGDDVWTFGTPMGLEGSVSRGVVSGFREKDDLDLIQITAPISPGSSGGPVIGEGGDVIGIATLIMTEGQNINFAVPVRKLQTLQFPEDNRESFPSASAFGGEIEELIDQLADLIVQMLESPMLELGQTYRGRLDRDSPKIGDRSSSIYQLQGEAGQRLQIDVTSRQFDTVASLRRQTGMLRKGAWYVVDDDGGDGTNSRIVVTLPDTDIYYLSVKSDDERMGAYTATVRDVSSDHTRTVDNRWQYVETSQSGQRFYVDTQTIRRIGPQVTVWVRQVPRSVERLDSGDRFDTALGRFDFNCTSSEYRLTSTSYRFEGRLVMSEDRPLFRQTWEAIEPMTVVEAVLDHVCQR